MRSLYKTFSVALLATTLIACSNDDDNNNSGTDSNIVEVAKADGSFTTLVAALETSGLAEVLADETKNYTVFAPTDAAFTALLTKMNITAADLLASPDLEDILLYHVIVGDEVNAAEATAVAILGETVLMGNGDKMALSLSGSELFANLSKIVQPNVGANNGIIHAVDTVLLPPAADARATNIVATAQGDSRFSILVSALSATSDLVATLSNPNGDFTVFAPTDAAFNALPAGLLNTLLQTPDGTLRDILLKHVVSGSVDSVTAFTLNGMDVETVNGETVNIAIDSGKFTVDGAQVTTFDIVTTNGVIHVIDAVITLDP